MENSSDDVSSIHNRYSLTLINPSSHYFSLIISVAVVCILTTTTVFGYLRSDDLLLKLVLVTPVLVGVQFLDSRFIKNKEYSKSLHMSLFGNVLWLITILVGLLSVAIFSKSEASLFYIAEGMFIFASFRIGIFTTVLGVNLPKAWAVCFIQPLVIFLALIPYEMWSEVLLEPTTLAFGTAFLIIASVWSTLTDRAGRPGVKSTHKLVQAYISSQGKDFSEIESLMEERSKKSKITTSQIRFSSKEDNSEFRMVLPEIHPGPYHPIGGSNIPYMIYKNMDSSAMVMHSISDHALNLPSEIQVNNYLQSITKNTVSNEGATCTEPVTVQINNARVIGLLFDKNAILFLSLSPHGMEDLPIYVKNEIEQFAKNREFESVMVVDCHNAMGEEISKENSDEMLKAAKSCLDTLMTKESFPFEFGYANSDEMKIKSADLGLGGIGVLCLRINGKKYFLGWVDSNNMENGLREKIVNYLAEKNYTLLEICTSDTHYSPVKARNKNGYYHFGSMSKQGDVSKWYFDVVKESEKSIKFAKFEILENESDVKVMGPKIFEDYSKALDNSLKLTKGFLIGSVVLFLSSMMIL